MSNNMLTLVVIGLVIIHFHDILLLVKKVEKLQNEVINLNNLLLGRKPPE